MGKHRHQGAAIFPVAKSTGRILVGLRSDRVSRPHTWAPIAGKRESGETYKQTAIRELAEETGYDGPIDVRRMPDGPSNLFLGIVVDEFPPILNWENTDAQWVTLTELLQLTRR